MYSGIIVERNGYSKLIINWLSTQLNLWTRLLKCFVYGQALDGFIYILDTGGTPTYTVFTTEDPTIAIFGLCTRKCRWNPSLSVSWAFWKLTNHKLSIPKVVSFQFLYCHFVRKQLFQNKSFEKPHREPFMKIQQSRKIRLLWPGNLIQIWL